MVKSVVFAMGWQGEMWAGLEQAQTHKHQPKTQITCSNCVRGRFWGMHRIDFVFSEWKSSPVSVFDLWVLRLRLRLVCLYPETKKTRRRPQKTMVFSLLQSLVYTSLNWFKTSLSANILQLWIINMNLSFKMSPRTLIYVKNWCIYKINLVHLLISTVFYIFKHNFVSFGPINMFLCTFWRAFKGLQQTSPNQSKPVHLDRSFCSLYISKTKRPDCRSGLFQSLSGLCLVFFWSCDWTFKHYLYWLQILGF